MQSKYYIKRVIFSTKLHYIAAIKYNCYFEALELDWKAVAEEKARWANHRNGWIKSWYEGQSAARLPQAQGG